MSPETHRLYILDTAVLLHDPTALFRFDEHDVAVPTPVLRELDACKRGVSEEARNARQASRFLDELVGESTPDEIAAGLALASDEDSFSQARGRLFFVDPANGDSGDDGILAAALAVAGQRPSRSTVLVTKDINLRIRASVAGLISEDYHSDQVLDDVDLLYTGLSTVARDQIAVDGDTAELATAACGPLSPNEMVFADDDSFAGRVTSTDVGGSRLQRLTDYAAEDRGVWGVRARNREQNAALNLLMDPEVDFVSLLGPAGTGKTLLALAAGLAQCFDVARYREIIMTRATVAIGDDIGYLPGTEEEKMTPWMGALMDNLEVLGEPDNGGRWGQAATRELLQSRIKIRSLNFMRGRTFLDRFLILDEAQNLTPKQMKTLITRAGPGTKLLCLGNIAQIDTPYLTETTSGLTYVVDRFRDWAHSGHITLTRGERSRLADYASEYL
jgi:PhoH-like ATPase